MTPDEIDSLIPRDTRDDMIDEWAFGPSDDYCKLAEPAHVTLRIWNLSQCQALIDMSLEILMKEKVQFISDKEGGCSSSALSASYKVVATRELLRQLFALRDREEVT
jgi:hypothetical protein